MSFTFMRLRHSFGTSFVQVAGVARHETTQKAMRHSNISLTMGTYTDPRLTRHGRRHVESSTGPAA